MGVDLCWYLRLNENALDCLKGLGIDGPKNDRPGFARYDVSALFTLLGYPGMVDGIWPYYAILEVPLDGKGLSYIDTDIRERIASSGDLTSVTLNAVLTMHKFLLTISSECVLLGDSWGYNLEFISDFHKKNCRTLPHADALARIELPDLVSR